MKKVNYLVVLLITMCIGITSVNATYKEGESVGTTNFENTGISAYNLNFEKHFLTTNGKKSPIICLQPGYSAKNGRTIYVRKIETASSNEDIAAYAAGIQAIMKDIDAGSSDTDLVAATNAVRVFNMFFTNNNVAPNNNVGSGKVCDGTYCAHYRVAADLYNSWRGTYSTKIKKAIDKTSLASKIPSSVTANASSGLSSSVKSKAKSYFEKALNAAIKYRENGSVEGYAGFGAASTDRSVLNQISETRMVTLRDIPKSKAYLKVTCDDCAKNNISYTVTASKTKDGEYTPLAYNNTNNGYELISSALGTSANSSVDQVIYVRITFTNNRPANCSSASYKLSINAGKTSSDRVVYYLGYKQNGAWLTPSDGVQNFVAYLVDESNTDGDNLRNTKARTIDFCGSCEDLKDKCEAGHQPSCDEYTRRDCSECATKVNNIECSVDQQTIGIKEGIEVDTDCNPVGTTPTANIKGCIINNKDVAGNTYQATTAGYPNNKYCKVYCTENYDINVPGQVQANSGRYIKLTTNVSGTKACYTSKIDNTQFETDLEAARIAMIDAYNKWAELNAIVTASWTNVHSVGNDYDNGRTVPKTCTGTREVSTGSGEDKKVTTEQYSYSCPYCEVVSKSGCYSTKGTKIPKFVTYDYNGNRKNVSYPLEFGYASGTSSSCSSGSCSKLLYTSHYSSYGYETQRATASRALDNAITSYNKVISEYNSCSGTISQNTLLPATSRSTIWNMGYNFNPSITFWYEDKYYDIAKNKNLVTDGAIGKGALSIQTCSGEVNDQYECDSNWVPNSAATTNMTPKTVCYKSGSGYTCSSVAVTKSTANYVVQKQDVKANYELPTQYFTIYPSGKLINEKKTGTSPLEKALPISLNKNAGVYNYTLTFNNLGEYYDTGVLGRIWGGSSKNTSTVEAVLSGDNECKTEGAVKVNDKYPDGSYVCAYKVNCPACTVTCGPNGCVWQECDDNKCTIKCNNCIFTNGSSNYSYRSVTTKDINPNHRTLGSNWNSSEMKTATQVKAYKTTNDIIGVGEKIYDEDSEYQVLTVNLTQSMINDIKAYNKNYVNNGGYASDSLKCYDYTDEDGKLYENIYCYSTFIDEMYTKYNKNMNFAKNRISSSDGDAADNDAKRSKIKNQCESNKDCYWTPWTEALNSDESIKVSTSIGLTSLKNNYGTSAVDVGPSYR